MKNGIEQKPKQIAVAEAEFFFRLEKTLENCLHINPKTKLPELRVQQNNDKLCQEPDLNW